MKKSGYGGINSDVNFVVICIFGTFILLISEPLIQGKNGIKSLK